jgi:uncharacterized coiled-coil DUF342 family protein
MENHMNPVVISTIIAAASFTLTIFSAIYLNQRHVDKLIEQLEKRFETRSTGLEQRMEARITGLEQKMEARIFGLEQTMNARFDTMNARFDAVDQRLSGVESRLDRIVQVLFKPALPGA